MALPPQAVLRFHGAHLRGAASRQPCPWPAGSRVKGQCVGLVKQQVEWMDACMDAMQARERGRAGAAPAPSSRRSGPAPVRPSPEPCQSPAAEGEAAWESAEVCTGGQLALHLQMRPGAASCSRGGGKASLGPAAPPGQTAPPHLASLLLGGLKGLCGPVAGGGGGLGDLKGEDGQEQGGWVGVGRLAL